MIVLSFNSFENSTIIFLWGMIITYQIASAQSKLMYYQLLPEYFSFDFLPTGIFHWLTCLIFIISIFVKDRHIVADDVSNTVLFKKENQILISLVEMLTL